MKNKWFNVQAIRLKQVHLSFCLLMMVACVGFSINGNAQNFQQVYKGIADMQAASDEFGTSVSISGDYAVVGAPNEDEDASGGNFVPNAGAAYIYKRDGGGNWNLHQKIVSPVRTTTDQFGGSVSIDGDYIIVGAVLADSDPGTNTNSNEGAAYVFERNTTSGLWEYKSTLVAPVRANADAFGIVVTITSTGYAFVGASSEDEDQNDANFADGAGSAYFFERNGTTTNWDFKQKIVASDRTTFETFGSSLGVSGNFLVIGAKAEDVSAVGDNFGAAYVYQYNTGTGLWDEFAKLVAPTADRSSGDSFGVSVAIHGNWIVAGANFDDEKDDTGTDGTPLDNAGAAYIFKFDGTNWVYKKKIVAPNRLGADNFGNNVAISDNNMVITAQAEDEDADENNTINNTGSAYVFHLNAAEDWVLTKKITAGDRELNALFGSSVAMDGDDLIISARRKDEGTGPITDAGAMYIYKNGPFDPGMAFNGSNGYITLPNENNFDATKAFTIEAWVKFSGSLADGQYQSIVTKGNEAWRLRFKGTPDPVLLAFDYNGTNEITSSGSPDFKLGSWHHVAVVFDGTTTTKTLTLYIDGSVDATQTFSSDMIPNNDPVWIGNNKDDASILDGSVDDIRIWKRVKSITEIQAAKDCKLTGTEPCLAAYFDFSEGLPNTPNTFITEVKDLTGNNNGTLVGFTLDGNTSNFTDADPSLVRLANCTNPINLPLMVIEGNGNPITNGSFSFSTTNDTDLGEVIIGNTITRTYTIKNTGVVPLTLTNNPNYVQNLGNSDFTITSQPTSNTIAVGGQITFTVSFTPSIGDASVADIAIASNDCTNIFTFKIMGVGKPNPEIDVVDPNSNSIGSGGTYNMGSKAVGTGALTQTLTIQNTNTAGNLNLTGTAPDFVTISGSNDFSIISQPSSVIAANSSSTFQVSFTPSSSGTKTATLSIANDDADENPYTIVLTAQGGLPEINLQGQSGNDLVSGSTIDLGTVTVNTSVITQTFTIQNTDAIASLSLTGNITVSGNAAYSISAQPTSSTIAPEGSTTFTLSFNPNATGILTGTVSIANDDADENPYLLNFTTEVNPPDVPEITVIYNSSTDLTLKSGDILPKDTIAALNTLSRTITIRNDGTATLNLNSTNPFVFSGTNATEYSVDMTNAQTTIAVNDSATFTINFIPTALGIRTSTLTINNDDGNEGTFMINFEDFAIVPPTEPADVNVEPTTPPANQSTSTPNAATVTWVAPTDLTNIQGFRVRRSDGDTSNFALLAELDLNAKNFLDLNLVEGVQYYYRVYSFNQFGESKPGPLSSLVYVGIEETRRFANQTLVFPNPTSGQARVQFPSVNAYRAHLKIYTQAGKLMRESTLRINNRSIKYDLEGLANGRYLMQIQVGEYTIYKHIIKH